MSENILAITTPEDHHVDKVQERLGAEADILVYDPSKFPYDSDITFVFADGKMAIRSEQRDLQGVRSVWFRKPTYLKPEDQPVDAEYRQYAQDAYEYGVKALYDLLRNKFWMSPFRSIMTANNKLLQLELAHEVGFRVPETMLTNNPNDAASFHREFGHIVAKSLAFSPFQGGDGEMYAFFATRIVPGEAVDFSGLSIAPTIFQREVVDKLDVRVTIVGDKIFPCLIRPVGNFAGEVDWRSGILTDEVDYQVFEDFPLEMRSQCLRMVQKLGLTYSAMEFALDKNGRYWFIENNPNGQWLFVETATGMPISVAIAELLWRPRGK